MLLYKALSRLTPNPVVDRNRAVAVSFATGPATALQIVDGPASREALAHSRLLPSVRGEPLARARTLRRGRLASPT